MNTKKRCVIIGAFILLLIIPSFFPVVSALDLKQGAEDVMQVVEDISGPFFEFILGRKIGDLYFLERVLLFLIIFIMVNAALKRIPLFEGKGAVIALITIAVSILSARYLGNVQWVKTILLPYNMLGVVFAAGIPFLIFFFFIESFKEKWVRRIGWVFMLVVFGVLYYERKEVLGDPALIYLITAGISFVMLIFDRWVYSWYEESKIWKLMDAGKRSKAIDLMSRLRMLRDELSHAETVYQRKDIKKEIEQVKLNLKSLHRGY
ncbi:MAG: hypothetical protein KKF56_05835 [Nanoarchaeota archaeon]|nr:hypothetical protein [Nanoarchaeota archaeon]